MKKTKLALIGCGAVTERGHLPAANSLENCEVVMLIDRDKERARMLAKKFKIPSVSADYRDIVGKADSAILALPHNLHASVSIELLNAGIHVLIEKPMATSVSECEEILKAAEGSKAVLAVGLMRRFLHSALFTKQAIESGLLGGIESFDFREGNIYNWPVSSDFLFRPESAGGGVLFDTGSHTLDLLIWWLGEVSLTNYYDDNYGGVEADFEIHLKTKSGVEGIVELSRTRDLRNTAIIKCERGQIEVDLRKNHVSITTYNGRSSIIGHGQLPGQPDALGQGFIDLFPLQLRDFVDSIQNGRTPSAPGKEAARSVSLIAECYQKKKPLNLPWMSLQDIGNSVLKGKKVLVTGATGFIGGRLVERLVLEHGANVRALVRNFKNASRIARFPVEMIGGDILDKEVVSNAVEGCEIIFHCAYDFTGSAINKKEVSIKGTENICKAALTHKVKRLVHVSTISVYGSTPDGDLDENSHKQPSEDVYVKTKLAAEGLVLDYHKKNGLPVSVLQPTIVYGPYSRPWTITPSKQLKTGRVVLVNNGDGLCNDVYIDDVVDAMFLAAVKEEAVGEIFLISDAEPVTWRDFYGAFENVLEQTSTLSMSDKEIRDAMFGKGKGNNQGKQKAPGSLKQLLLVIGDLQVREKLLKVSALGKMRDITSKKIPWVFEYIKSILGISHEVEMSSARPNASAKPIYMPTDMTRLELFCSRTRVHIDKAHRLLGYEPKYNFKKGMSITAEFLKWSNLT